ncbi:apurinic apyrimidinic endonuclease [Babesia ovata]|uniref:Apurinic apyrimidinic endonuclease n=1 Tax=Babesia ovata TaxID=189622 RepID=A0A2H6K7J8_9APIC|nr:apurinic apyrimidinic endonuclease [Babesia ovata]GBE58966.1 apurinic apyrimidinic endonuclease [Babesia ovata]
MCAITNLEATSTTDSLVDVPDGESPSPSKPSAMKTKKTGIEKKAPKKLVQTKLLSKASAEKAVPWVTLPKLDPNEDRAAAFAEIAAASKKSGLYIGAHVSTAGGPDFAVLNAYNTCGQAFALFLKNQRRWDSPPLSDKSVQKFAENIKKCNYDVRYVLPHGSYLINIANPDAEKRKKSYEHFVDDIQRCEKLGITLYNFHPGSTVGMCDKSEGIRNIANCINMAMKETKSAKIVLENAAGQKNVIGSTFEDLRDIINLVENKERIAVCLDTCHLFAAGYDIRTKAKFEEVMKSFDKIVGLNYLVAVHLNDCKSDLGSGLDRHENIGIGKLTRETFEFIANSGYFRNMPIILETPDIHGDETIYKQEVKVMYSLFNEDKPEATA